MLEKEEVYKVLDHFRRRVIKEAKSNLTRLGKNASSDLYGSLDSELDVHKQSFSLQFFMMDYGEYIDKGVSGKKRRYNTPYSYTNKQPPSRAFEKWIKQKGIQPRDRETGRFMKTKTLSYLIARSVFNNGIKPSMFFTKPFEREFLKLDEELLDAFGLDIDEFLEQTLNA